MSLIFKKEHFDIIIKYINICCPAKRKPKYSNEYYLKNIFTLLHDVNSWRALRTTIAYKNGNLVNKSDQDIMKDNHFKTIWAKFKLWIDKGIFEKVEEEIRKTKVNNLENDNKLDLIIDATNIINKNGIECIGYGSENRKKQFTKLTVISDKNANAISIIHHETNKKCVQLAENKTKIINTLQHDIRGVIPSINKIKTNKEIILCGDAGYIVNDENKNKLKQTYNTTLITPYKKNQKKTNTEIEKQIIKKRPTVERAICKIKRFNRIHVRRDQKIRTYMGFVYIAYIFLSI